MEQCCIRTKGHSTNLAWVEERPCMNLEYTPCIEHYWLSVTFHTIPQPCQKSLARQHSYLTMVLLSFNWNGIVGFIEKISSCADLKKALSVAALRALVCSDIDWTMPLQWRQLGCTLSWCSYELLELHFSSCALYSNVFIQNENGIARSLQHVSLLDHGRSLDHARS